MSLENDISGLMDFGMLDESLSKARELYVDTGKMSPIQLKRLLSKDPTYDSKDTNKGAKYIQWIAKIFVSGQTRNSRVFDILKDFDDLVNQGKITGNKKTIGTYATPTDVTNEVHAAQARIAEESRVKKEKSVRKELTKSKGNIGNAYKYLNRKFYNEDDGVWTLIDGDNPDYVSKEIVQRVHDQMESEEVGATWRDFVIDEEMFDELKKEDIVFENKYVVIVEVKSKEMARFYGRNPWYDPTDRNSETGFWCVTYSSTSDYWNQYAYYDENYYDKTIPSYRGKNRYDRFYAIFPKDIEFVDDKRYAKVMLEADKDGERMVWDTANQAPMDDSDVERLFAKWKIRWQGRKRPQE